MKQAFSFVILGATLGLAGCGGGGAGTFGGGFSPIILAAQETPADSGSDTVRLSLIDDGIAGTIALAPGLGASAELQNIRIRASSDYQTIYVSINGGAEFALNATFPSDEFGGGYGPTGVNANYVGLSNLDDVSLISRTVDSSGGFGYAGIMTPDANLMSTVVDYTGTWTGYVNPQSVFDLTFGTGGGSMTLTFDPANKAMDGTFSGSLNIGSTNYPISGTVDSDLTGNVFAGSLVADTGTYQGSADLGGAIYGWDADTAAGAFAGSIDGGSGSHPFYGLINLDIDP